MPNVLMPARMMSSSPQLRAVLPAARRLLASSVSRAAPVPPPARTGRRGRPSIFRRKPKNKGGGGLRYKGRLKGPPPPGAPPPAYTRPPVQCTDAGNYDVVVTNL